MRRWQVAAAHVWRGGILAALLSAALLTGCAEEEVVQCFTRLSGDRYCVKVAESTSCALDLARNRVGCTDRSGNTTFPERFNFDDGEIWLPSG